MITVIIIATLFRIQETYTAVHYTVPHAFIPLVKILPTEHSQVSPIALSKPQDPPIDSHLNESTSDTDILSSPSISDFALHLPPHSLPHPHEKSSSSTLIIPDTIKAPLPIRPPIGAPPKKIITIPSATKTQGSSVKTEKPKTETNKTAPLKSEEAVVKHKDKTVKTPKAAAPKETSPKETSPKETTTKDTAPESIPSIEDLIRKSKCQTLLGGTATSLSEGQMIIYSGSILTCVKKDGKMVIETH